MKTSRRRSLTIAVVACTSLAVALPALAEGSFNSDMKNVLTGFHSRNWTDNDSDNNNTSVRLTACSSDNPATDTTTGLRLYQNKSFEPDPNYGNQYFQCGDGGTDKHNWGNPGAGKFYFDVYYINGQTSGDELSVQSLTVAW